MAAITVEDLIRHLDRLKARGPIPFDVKEGEIFGLLCSRGTARSTLISVIVTLLIPMPGFAERSAFAILESLGEIRRSVGIVFQEPVLDPETTVRENLDFHARLYGLDPGAREARIREALGQVGLVEKADLPVKACTPGMVRRLEIARSLLHRPTVLFLVEPTGGLELSDRRGIRDILKRLNRERRMTIVFTTHLMEEVDCLCDRVAVVDGGEIVALDTPEAFREMLGEEVVSLELEDHL